MNEINIWVQYIFHWVVGLATEWSLLWIALRSEGLFCNGEDPPVFVYVWTRNFIDGLGSRSVWHFAFLGHRTSNLGRQQPPARVLPTSHGGSTCTAQPPSGSGRKFPCWRAWRHRRARSARGGGAFPCSKGRGHPNAASAAKVGWEWKVVAAAPQCREDGAAGGREGAKERRVAEWVRWGRGWEREGREAAVPGLVLQPQPSGLLRSRREHLLLWDLCEDFFLLSCPALFLASTRDGRGATGRGLLVGVGHPLASAALWPRSSAPGEPPGPAFPPAEPVRVLGRAPHSSPLPSALHQLGMSLHPRQSGRCLFRPHLHPTLEFARTVYYAYSC